MRIGLFYESQFRPLVERLEVVLTQLGHVVEIDCRHQSEIDELGWVVVMNRIFNSCDGVIGVQTVDGILDDGWRGVNEEQALLPRWENQRPQRSPTCWLMPLTRF
jgi:hypothetical protein